MKGKRLKVKGYQGSGARGQESGIMKYVNSEKFKVICYLGSVNGYQKKAQRAERPRGIGP